MTISSEEFRDALRHFPSGVTVVTIKSGEQIHGLTVSAFASVSPDPPLIAVIIDHRHRAHVLLEQEGAVFAVNILGQSQIHLSDRFAWVEDEDRFLEGSWTTAVTGVPVLADALAWLDCTILSRHVAGTHTIYVGEVQASGVPQPGGRPLVYWNREYGQLELPEREQRSAAADTQAQLNIVRDGYRPFQVVALGVLDVQLPAVPLLRGRGFVVVDEAAYVCRKFTCQAPTTEPEGPRALLERS